MTSLRLKIACVLSPEEANQSLSDVYLFPEGCSRTELRSTSLRHPSSIVAGAYAQTGYSIGVAFKDGTQILTYRKVESDGRTKGSGDASQCPIYTDANRLCIGVIVCMDIDHVAFSSSVIDAVKKSCCAHRLICIPADMDSRWFPGRRLPGPDTYDGINVALCNNLTTHADNRCRSFISNTHCDMIVRQEACEPISYILKTATR